MSTKQTYRDEFPETARAIRYLLAAAFVSVGVAGLFGMLQALFRTDYLRFFSNSDYYTILTAHGVMMAYFFTIFSLVAIFAWAVTRSLDRPFPNPKFTMGWVWLMIFGAVLTLITIFGKWIPGLPLKADVLYTFYAPMKASPTFYLGLALFVVGSWLAGYDYFRTWWSWKQDNPDERIPLQTFMALTTMLMWYLSSLGVAIEVLVLLLPWSIGIVKDVNPLLTRSLFWYTGHAIVYFWLLPAYLLWYTVLPKLSGGRLFSDPLARVVFVLFLLLSTPVGFHHQYLDPGISQGFKFVTMTTTMFIVLPSLVTAFTVVASMEHGARQRGGKGYLSWLRALPWEKPEFSAMALAGLMFAAGGFSGMINAGMNIDYRVHNTIWIPGHFHLTVGTAVGLTLMGASYWLIPQLTGKRLRLTKLAMVQPYLWFVGMTFMSNAMHRAGLTGDPRRTADPTYQDVSFHGIVGSMGEMRMQIALGGVLLFVSLLLFLAVITRTWLGERDGDIRVNGVIPPALSGPEDGPRVLDNLWLWMGIAILLVIIVYAIPFAGLIGQSGLFGSSPGVVPGWILSFG